ncbi:MAG: hypothetical protein ABNG97_05400 [Sulfitobacter sp.]|jgi:hypothetical protein
MMRPFTLCYGFLPVWWRPREGAWHQSRGPVQYVGRAVFESPEKYPVTVTLAAVAASNFYFVALVSIVVTALALWLSPWVLLGLALAGVIGRRAIRCHWLAVRYALALSIAGAEPQILFWAGNLATETGIDRGVARALLEGYLARLSRVKR